MRSTASFVIGFLLTASVGSGGAATDDFDDNFRNIASWFFVDSTAGNGMLQETNARLEYSCGTGTAWDSASRTWIRTRQNVDTTWSVQLDVANAFAPAGAGEFVSFGLFVEDPTGTGEVTVYLTQSSTETNVYKAQLLNNGTAVVPDVATTPRTLNAGAVRISYNPATRVFTTWYDSNGATGGYAWTLLARFGIGGSGGADGNADWGKGPTAPFTVGVFGVSGNTAVTSGTTSGDHFTIAGDPDIIVFGKRREIANNDRKPSRKDGTDFRKIKRRKKTHRFTVQNRGTDPLAFVAPKARLRGSGKNRRAFRLKGKPPGALASRRVKVLRVIFKPETRGRYRTWLMIFSQDPDEPLFRFRLGGKSRG